MVETVVSLGLGVGATALSSSLRDDPESTEQPIAGDNKPTPRAQRGTFVPLLIGRDRLSAIPIWNGNRETETETVGGGDSLLGGKDGIFGSDGDTGVTQTTYFEDSIHVVCVGPATKLHRIYFGGKAIFEGPVDSNSHPSGSTLDLGEDGEVQIWWGEPDQSTSEDLEEILDIDSRWPFYCRFHWRQKNLGTSNFVWQLTEYDIERRPTPTHISGTKSWIPSQLVELNPDHLVVAVNNGVDGAAWIEVEGKQKKFYKAGGYVSIDGMTGVDDDVYEIEKCAYKKDTNRTRIFLSDDFDGLTVTGVLHPVKQSQDDGANLAHALAQLLFAPWPEGRGLSREDFDIESLEELAELVSEDIEALPGRCVAKSGESFQSMVAAILEDVGVAATIGSNAGYGFFAIRDPDEGPKPVIPESAVIQLPDLQIDHGPKATNRIKFTWRDRKHNFRDGSDHHDGDGHALLDGFVATKSLHIASAIDARTAAKIVDRKALMILGGGPSYRIEANRAARRIRPGQYFEVENIPFGFRCWGRTLSPNSGKVTLDAPEDYFGVVATTSADTPADDDGSIGEEPKDPEYDPIAGAFLVPPSLQPGNEPMIGVFRVRAKKETYGATIWISTDGGDVYSAVGKTMYHAAGGITLDELPDDAQNYLEEGPRISIVGEDIDRVLDLTTDEDAWKGGKQIAMIQDSSGNWEICYLRNVEMIDDATARLKGLIRKRHASGEVTRDIGSKVAIMKATDLFSFSNHKTKQKKTVHIKIVPFAGGEGIPIEEIDPIELEIQNWKTQVPEVRHIVSSPVVAPKRDGEFIYRHRHPNGGALRFRWSYRSHIDFGSGSGEQPSGQKHSPGDPNKKFIVRILDSFFAEVRKVVIKADDDPYEFNYGWAALLADFGGGAPAIYYISICQARKNVEGVATTNIVFVGGGW